MLDGMGGRYVRHRKKKRLIHKQYIILARGGAKSMYAETLQAFNLVVDTTTTYQITTAPTMKQAEEVMSPFRTAITRARGPLFKFLIYNSSMSAQIVAAIAGAKITPTTPRNFAVTRIEKNMISGCKSRNLLNT